MFKLKITEKKLRTEGKYLNKIFTGGGQYKYKLMTYDTTRKAYQRSKEDQLSTLEEAFYYTEWQVEENVRNWHWKFEE